MAAVFRTQVLVPDEENCVTLVWVEEYDWKAKREICPGIAWRVVNKKGFEHSIYDNPTSAHDAVNNLNLIEFKSHK